MIALKSLVHTDKLDLMFERPKIEMLTAGQSIGILKRNVRRNDVVGID